MFWIICIVSWIILARMGWKIFSYVGAGIAMDDDIIIANHLGYKSLAVDLMRSHNERRIDNPCPDYGFPLHYLAILAVIPVLIVFFIVLFLVLTFLKFLTFTD